MSEGMALALPSPHQGFVQGKDHPGLPCPFGRASSQGSGSAPGLRMPPNHEEVSILVVSW